MSTFDPGVFKAYDVRGLYPDQIDETLAREIGRGFVAHLSARRIAVSRDMRLSSPAIAAAFIEGARAQGADVVDLGLLGTDQLYFAVARADLDGGAQITASHNPGRYNGIKLVGRGALPLSGDAGISDIRDMLLADSVPAPAQQAGAVSVADVLGDYLEHILGFIDVEAIRPYSLVLDAGSGIAGLVAPPLFDRLPCRTQRLCFEVDGSFPNHEANPLLEENRRDLVAAVTASSADAGIAWDGDADRCFFVDGEGEFVSGDFITALLAEAFLVRDPGATVLYDVRASHAVKDTVAAHGGSSLMNRVGHAFFKTRMREENAIFGGEVTGHYYFRENFYADNGFIPALLILELMSARRQTLRELLAPLRERYFISGEINTALEDQRLVAQRIEALAAKYADGYQYRMDGISVEYPTWHFNVRPSNTEPLLRLNLEGSTPEEMAERRDEVLAVIRS
ncbi:MAG: phosphomannomutase/phosphoglucomutase [Acidobacteria bacterium]|nr:phosphomannomutase/phosphoglucomutase [Acidobacteriota bacterium]|tara:strand:+ start:6387 stop:7745 length:1359 start_codon:yes stop_codon:yes gene_type:complete